MTNYLSLTIKEINSKLINKEIKPIDLVNEAFYKIENSNYNAFITLNKEDAINKAIELEDKEVDNILFGIPIAIKDNILTKNLRTTAASHILDDFIPIYDATAIKKVNEANMIIIGKTNMDEFAMGSTGETSYFGPALNPWNKEKVPGGSSSGNAAAISAGLTLLAIGSDTGGSIRQPASFCGLVGLKATYGRISRYGVIAFSSSLDQLGPMSRNVYENALLLNILSGQDENDLTSSNQPKEDFTRLINADIKGMKIAIPNYYLNDTINIEIKNKVLDVIELLRNKGCIVDMIDIDYLEQAIPLYQVIALGEASSNLARYDGIKFGYVAENFSNLEELYKNTRTEGFGREVKRRMMIGSYILSGKNAHKYYHKALRVRNEMTNSFKETFKKYDLILGPTNTDVAYNLGTKEDDALKSFFDDLLTIPVNMAGLPALSLPIGFNKEHLPIGLHIIGNYFEESKIYQLASYIEKELNLDLNPKGGK
jgi:aspartyl-tRNA(Asn)/glutamyl-tRNA(Gln) amidotransferase subunit A